MDILVIGGTGVISTAIVDRLNELSHNVTVFNRGLRQTRCKGKVNVITGDKNDAGNFKLLMKDRSFDAVIDMISYNSDDAAVTIDTLAGHVKHFVFTSTVAVYKRPYRGVPVLETHEVFSEDSFPYGYYKARMEEYLHKKMKEGIAITIIRPSLTYGIGCQNIGVMRNNYGIVTRIREKKPIVVFGDGTGPWSWTFAPDIAKAYAGVLNREACFGETYHACSDDHRIWDDLYMEFGRLAGEEPRLVHISTEMLMKAAPDTFAHIYHEKMHFGIYDNTKIHRDVPEFVCEYTLQKIVNAIYDWYESDAQARIVNCELDRLEDSIAAKYYQCMSIMGE